MALGDRPLNRVPFRHVHLCGRATVIASSGCGAQNGVQGAIPQAAGAVSSGTLLSCLCFITEFYVTCIVVFSLGLGFMFDIMEVPQGCTLESVVRAGSSHLPFSSGSCLPALCPSLLAVRACAAGLQSFLLAPSACFPRGR